MDEDSTDRPPMNLNLISELPEDTFATTNIEMIVDVCSESQNPYNISRNDPNRFSRRRVKKRIIRKRGESNVVQGNMDKRRRRYFQDVFTTLIGVKWRWTILAFAMSFVCTWFVFAVFWYLIAYSHQDLPNMVPKTNANATFIPCVTEIKGFLTSFLFSVETQYTIGYGFRYITEECPEAIFTLCFQCILGVLIQAFMVGIVLAKLSRPKTRAQTLLFSRNAVVNHFEGGLCLMFRVADMRYTHIIEANIRAQIVCKKVTKEGEVLPFHQQELILGSGDDDNRLLFIWPTIVLHKIDHQSPLYGLSACNMMKEKFEIIVILEGIVESTGTTTQARTSYLPTEILWGHRFENMITYRQDISEYDIDYQKFNNTLKVDTPLCSSKALDEIRTDCHWIRSIKVDECETGR